MLTCRVRFFFLFRSTSRASTAVQLPSAHRCDDHTYSAFTEGTEMCRDLGLQWILPQKPCPSERSPCLWATKAHPRLVLVVVYDHPSSEQHQYVCNEDLLIF